MYEVNLNFIWTASSEFGTYRLCEQRRFRRACASAQSRQNLRCSLIQAVNQEEPSDRKPDPWPLWMAGHAQLKFVMTECSKTEIRLTGLIWYQQKWHLHNIAGIYYELSTFETLAAFFIRFLERRGDVMQFSGKYLKGGFRTRKLILVFKPVWLNGSAR